ncbi:MAG: leucine-rich repeat domain-containing protein [Clostridiales bacterium]|nr:leucine-rich repeat domain-containing protein [Clostridiales bacterium]
MKKSTARVKISSGAFGYCNGLTSVSIGTGITSIEEIAFISTGLTSVTIPNSVEALNYSVFQNCSDLEIAVIGSAIISVGNSVFFRL